MKIHVTSLFPSRHFQRPASWLGGLLAAILLLTATGYKVRAQNFDIGTGTTANSSTSYPTPFGAFYSGQRAQYLYRAAELTAAGMTAGPINQIAFNVTAINGSGLHANYNIQIGGTTVTNLTTWQTVANTVYTNVAGVTPVLGYNVFSLSPAFTWNGTDNIIVEVCHWNGQSTYTYNASVPGTSVSNTSLYYSSDLSGPFCGNNSLFANTTSTRPNIRFTRLTPCSGKPTAGTITPVTPCPNVNFTLSATAAGPLLSGLSYQWQYLNVANAWSNIVPGNASSITYSISQPTTVRLVVTCTNSGQSDTTAPYLLNLGSYYNCYCGSNSTISSTLSTNIGNVTLKQELSNLTVLNNGTSTPVNNNATANKVYTDYRNTVSAPCLYRDSLYRITVAQINQASFYASTISAFIDYNHDGNFNSGTERVFNKSTTAATNPVNDTFRIPAGALYGTTGMRVIIQYGSGTVINPCGTYNYGETEDYLVNICFPPCSGPANAGTALSTDTVVCPGYTIDLTDTTHEKMQSGLAWAWEISNNAGYSWTTVPNSAGKDTLNNVLITAPVQYRLRMRCTGTGDTTYSNAINITNGQNFQCYAVSQSTGNKLQDSSDIGTFSIGNYVMPIGSSAGPHVKNPLANRHHTNYTQQDKWIYLNADSTYPVAIYHTLNSDTHADALVSIFMDFNNNLQYDALVNNYPYSPERVFTGISTSGNWYITGNITIPNAVVPETPTGLRVIINNDLNPNAAANLGTGPYISGETEDYVVVFHRYDPTKVSTTGLVKEVLMYPNPTDGRVTLGINSAKDIAKMDVVVTTMTGQTILTRSYAHTGTQFTTDLNLAGQASGVYFVEVRADGDRIVRKLVIR